MFGSITSGLNERGTQITHGLNPSLGALGPAPLLVLITPYWGVADVVSEYGEISVEYAGYVYRTRSP